MLALTMMLSGLAALGVLREAGVVSVEVDASSRRATASDALDGRERTAWCPARGDREATLELTFSRPVALTRVELMTDFWTAPERLPSALEVRVDDERAAAPEAGALDRVTLDGTPRGRLRLRVIGGDRCVPEILLSEGSEVIELVYGLEPAALRRLPGFALELAERLESADERALDRVVRFPLRLDYDLEDIRAERSRFTRASFASADELREFRRERGWPDFHDFHERDAPGGSRWELLARALSSVSAPSPGRLTIATGQGGNMHWELAWARERWQVTRIYDNPYAALRR